MALVKQFTHQLQVILLRLLYTDMVRLVPSILIILIITVRDVQNSLVYAKRIKTSVVIRDLD